MFASSVTHIDVLKALDEVGPMTCMELSGVLDGGDEEPTKAIYQMAKRRLDALRASGMVVRSECGSWTAIATDHNAYARARRMDAERQHRPNPFTYLEPDDVLDVLRDNGPMTVMEIAVMFRPEAGTRDPYAQAVRLRLNRLQKEGKVSIEGRRARAFVWGAVE